MMLFVALFILIPSLAFAGITRVNVNAYDTVVLPEINGIKKPIAVQDRTYPSRDQFGQFSIFINTSGTSMLLVHAKDTAPITTQEWEIITNDANAPCVNGQYCLRISFFSAADPTVTQTTFTGSIDWTVPAAVYKAWAQQQSWYVGHGKIASGQLAYVENCATNAYTYYQSNIQPLTTAFGLLGNKRVGCFMTQYRTSAFDHNYPDYTCAALANCAAWLQNLKNSGNGFGLPYLNGVLWDQAHASYSAANMCQNSVGSPLNYAGTLDYIDPLLATLPQMLYDSFVALKTTDQSVSEGVYIDVGAAVAKVCYYGGGPWVADYDAWITGIKAVLSKFTNQIVMVEGGGEIYIPYTDIFYLAPASTNDPLAVGLFGYIYHDVPGFHIVGIHPLSTRNCHQEQYTARNTFHHSAALFSTGFTCDDYLANAFSKHPAGTVDGTRRAYYSWSNAPKAGTRAVRP